MDIACGDNQATICFGWLKLQIDHQPSNAETVKFTSNSKNATPLVILISGETRRILGQDLGQEVTYTAQAMDHYAQPIVSQTLTATVACGENVMAANLTRYGIVASAAPDRIPADGQSTSTITATLREWQAGDILEPTGNPVAGKQVRFHTTQGTLTGANPGTTDGNGQVHIALTSAEDGEAEVVAFVADDAQEGHVTVQIGEVTGTAEIRVVSEILTDYGGLVPEPDWWMMANIGIVFAWQKPAKEYPTWQLTVHRTSAGDCLIPADFYLVVCPGWTDGDSTFGPLTGVQAMDRADMIAQNLPTSVVNSIGGSELGFVYYSNGAGFWVREKPEVDRAISQLREYVSHWTVSVRALPAP